MKLRRFKRYHANYWPTVKWLLILMVITFAFFRGYKVSVDNLSYQVGKETQAHIEDLRQERDYLKEEVNKLNEQNNELKKQVSLPQEVKVASYIKHKFGNSANQALAVFRCESGLRPTARGYNSPGLGSDWGVAQINDKFHKVRFEKMFGVPFEEGITNYRLNIDYAKYLYDHNGWQSWSASARCHGMMG